MVCAKLDLIIWHEFSSCGFFHFGIQKTTQQSTVAYNFHISVALTAVLVL